MALFECPRCGREAASNDSCVGAFELPPTVYCIHGDDAVKMELVTDAKIKDEAIVHE